MRRIVPIDSVQQIGMLADGLVPSLPAEDFDAHAPDLHLMAMEHGIIAGRLSVWWKHPPTQKNGEKLGAIGHYAVADEAAGVQLLEEAVRILREQGLHRVIAPINGSLWRQHRFITASSSHKPFFLEPQHPPEYPHHLQRAHFQPLLTWDSTESPIPLTPSTPTNGHLANISLRPINLSDLDAELTAIHALITYEARHAPIHSTLSRHAFLAKHRRARAITVPDLTLLAEQAGKLVGFVFAVPDLLQDQRGQPLDTLVVSNLVAASGRAAAGVGRLLLCELYRRARERGLCRVIHAMVPQGQPRRLNGEVIRQYTLFARDLQP